MAEKNFVVKKGLTVNSGTISLKEQANAEANVASYGQLWVKNTGDGLLYFTDDDGTDIQITTATGVNAGGIHVADMSVSTASASGSGSLAINTGTGVLTFTPANLQSITAGMLATTSGTANSSSVLRGDNTWVTGALTDTVRTVTAGGNTLATGETLAFTAGTGITIAESAGAVTITNSSSGGASTLSGLSDVLIDATNWTEGFHIQPDSNGSAPTTGTLNGATYNVGIGADALMQITSGHHNIAFGMEAGRGFTSGQRNISIGGNSMWTGGTQSKNVAIGYNAMSACPNGADSNVGIG